MIADINITDSYFFSLEGFIVVAIIVVASSALNKFRKNISGRYLVERLEQLDHQTYHLISNVPFKMLGKKIDHIVLSTYGIFIIERHNYNGILRGSKEDTTWTLQIKKRQKSIANPLMKLEEKLTAIADELNLKDKNIYPILAFSNATKLDVEQGLIRRYHVVNYDQINDAIQFQQTPKIANATITELVQQLEDKKQKK